MTSFLSPSKRYTPAGGEISEAIAEVLRGYDEPPRPHEMRELLLKEHPNWKIPERRVKKFIKRHVSRHQDPAGADDDTVTSSVKTGSPMGRALLRLAKPFSSKRNVKSAPPMTIGGGDIPEASPHPAQETAKKEAPKPVEKKPEPAPEPVPSPTAADNVEVEFLDRAAIAYEDDNIGKKDKCECNACVIS